MLKTKTKIRAIAISGMILSAVFASSFRTLAAPDTEINYQGKLTDTSDVAVADGSYNFILTLWDASSGGNCVWSARGTCGTPTAKSVALSKGIFSTRLGEQSDNSLSSLDFNSNYYLQVQIGSDSPMDVRKKIGTTGFAVNALRLGGESAVNYALLTGRSGGQNLIGGTSANETLSIQGNSASSGNTSTNAGIQMKVGNSGGTIAMTILNGGNVGIGTTTPNTNFHVEGSRAGYYLANINNTDATTGNGLLVTNNSTGGYRILGVYNGSTERFSVKDNGTTYINGNVGIGTSTPGVALDVNGHIAIGYANELRFRSSTGTAYKSINVNDGHNGYYALRYLSNGGDAEADVMHQWLTNKGGTSDTAVMSLTRGGNLGIGTTTPSGKLQVTTAGANQLVTFDTTTSGYSFLSIQGYSSSIDATIAGSEGAGLYLKNKDTTSGNFSRIVGQDAGGNFVSQLVFLNQDDTNNQGAMSFWTRPSGGNLTERIRVSSDGNVGIGTTSPVSLLTVGDTANAGGIVSTFKAGGFTTYIDVGSSANRAMIYTGGSLNNLAFGTNSLERMRIDNNGNVGIGTTAPTYRLDVEADGNGSYISSIVNTNSGSNENGGLLIQAGTGGSGFPLVVKDYAGNIRFRVSSDGGGYFNGGNVGIGTTTPAELLQVAGYIKGQEDAELKFKSDRSAYFVIDSDNDETDRAFSFYHTSASASNEVFRIQENGNVGIGTTTPGYKLDVNGSFNATSIYLNGTAMATTTVGTVTGQTLYWNGSAWTASSNLFNNGTNVGIGTTTPSQKLEIYGGKIGTDGILFDDSSAGTGFSAYTYAQGGIIGSSVAGGTYPFDVNGNLIIASRTNGTARDIVFATGATPSERMVITGAGNVGIGTTTPGSYKLNVNGNLVAQTIYASTQVGTSAVSAQYIGDSSNLSLTGGSTGSVILKTGSTEHARITSDGNVGIGTTSPGARLHVVDSVSGSVAASIQSTSATSGYGLGISTANSNSNQYALDVTTGAGNILRVINAGNVGIGTTAPIAKLNVAGGLAVSGNSAFGTSPNSRIGLYASQTQTATANTQSLEGARIAPTFATATYTSLLTAGQYIASPSYSGTGSISSTYGLVIENYGNALATTSHGLWIASQTGSSTNYAIYSAGGTNYFAGNVGIGTTTPVSALDVYGGLNLRNGYSLTWGGAYGAGIPTIAGVSGGSGYLAFYPTGSTSGEKVRIDSNGNVGIGTTAPGATLHLTGGDTASAFTKATIALGYSTTGQYPQFIHTRHNSASSASNAIDFYTSDGTANGVFPTNAILGMTITNGNVGIGTTSPGSELDITTSGSQLFRVNTWGSGVNLDDMTSGGILYLGRDQIGTGAIHIGPSSSQAVLYIPTGSATGSGNVGIGTTTPVQLLQVAGIAKATSFQLGSGSSSVGAYLELTNLGGDVSSNDVTLTAANSTNSVVLRAAQTVQMYTYSSGYQERMRIVNNGNVGIGTTNPIYKLEVSGNLYASGPIFSNSYMKTNDNTGHVFGSDNDYMMGYNATTDNLEILDGSTIGTNVRVVLKNDGNVGIGTTTPAATLHVGGGNIRLDSGKYLGWASGAKYYDSNIYSVTNDLQFTSFNGADVVENMRIKASTGNVGIGTTAPGYQLQIKNSTTGAQIAATGLSSADLILNTSNNVSHPYTTMLRTLYSSAHSMTLTAGDNGLEVIGQYSDNTALMSGNVGIGTTTPSQKLDIQGNEYLNGTLNFPNSDADKILFLSDSTKTKISHESGYLLRLVAGGSGGGTGIVAFNTGSTEKMRIDANGNVGIGTTNPTLGKLDILSSSTNEVEQTIVNLAAGSNATYGAQRLFFKIFPTDTIANRYSSIQSGDAAGTRTLALNPGGGNVGIGTTSPITKLDVNLASSGVAENIALTNQQTAAAGVGSSLRFVGISDSTLGRIQSVMEDAGSNTYMAFQTRKSGSPTEQMRIISTGNVGIGTTTPGAKLHIANTSGNSILALQSAEQNWAQVLFEGDTTGTEYVIGRNDVSDADIFVIGRSGGYNDFVLNSSGNVGIGTTSPQDKVEIVGNIILSQVSLGRSGTEYGSVGNNIRYTGTNQNYTYKSSDYASLMRMDSGGFNFFTAPTGTAGNTVSFTNRLAITNAGNVGIGTTTPGYKLEVNGSLNVSSLYVNGSAIATITSGTVTGQTPYWNGTNWAASSNLFNNGTNVGIGTTTPGAKLEVAGSNSILYLSGSNSALQVGSGADKGFYIQLSSSPFSMGTSLGGLHLYSASSSTPGVISLNPAGTNDTSKWTVFSSGGNVGIGTTTPGEKFEIYTSGINGPVIRLNAAEAGAGAWGLVAGASGNGQGTGKFGIYDYDGTSYRFVVDSTGNVGIGTTTPSQKLHVIGNVAWGDATPRGLFEVSGGDIHLSNEQGSVRQRINIHDGSASSDSYIQMQFTDDSWASTINAMHIQGNGNVGIGTSTPDTRLDITASGANGLVINQRTDNSTTSANLFFTDDSGTVSLKTASGRFGIYNGATIDSSSGTERVSVISSGYVGIGTTTPGSLLDVAGETYATKFTNRANSLNYVSFNGSSNGLYLGANNNTLIWDSQDFYPGNDNVRSLGTTSNRWSDLQIGSGTSSFAGNVGIGTTTPVYKLEVDGTSDFGDSITLSNGAYGTISFGPTGYEKMTLYAASGKKLALGAGGTQGQMIIDTTGNVGIGTTSPASPLHIQKDDSTAYATTMTAFPGNTSYIYLQNNSGSANAYTGLFMNTNGGYSSNFTSFIGSVNTGASMAGRIMFMTRDGSSSYLTERMAILNGGNVGIGTTTPGYKLEVNGSLNVSSLYVNGSAIATITSGTITGQTPYWNGTNWAASSNLFNNGTNVGIGTTSPTAKLHVGSGIESNSASAALITGARGLYSSSAGLYTGQFSVYDSTSMASGVGGAISFLGNYTGTTPTWFASIAGIKENGTAANYAGALVFNTRVNGGVATEKLRITSDGNVGIGTTSPAQKLHVAGTIFSPDDQIHLFGDSSDVRMYWDNTTSGVWKIDTRNASSGWSNRIWLGSWADTEELAFMNTNVGIGTTTPNYKLEVNGVLGFTDAGGSGSTYDSTISQSSVSPFRILTLNSKAGTGSWRGAINFDTNYNNGSTFTAMTIRANTDGVSGNVGIGTTSPSTKLFIKQSSETATQGIGIESSGGGSTGVIYSDGSSMVLREGGVDTMYVNGGNVGIGTSTPDKKFHIYDSSAWAKIQSSTTTNYALLDITNTTNQLRMGVENSSGGGLVTGSAPYFGVIGTTADYGLHIRTNNSIKMTVLSGGNVGIGTTTPTNLLHTQGSQNAYLSQIYNTNTGTSAGGLYIRSDGGGSLLNLNYNGTEIYNFTATGATFNAPASFQSVGDVSIAYDLLFTNQTASFIKSNAPITIEAGEIFESNDLTLRTYNSGDVILDAPGGVTLMQAQAWNLATSTTALNIQSGLLTLDTTNSNVGIGTTAPTSKLEVAGNLNVTGSTTFLNDVRITEFSGVNYIQSGADRVTSSWQPLYFGPYGSTTGIKMVIDSSGNVGIGTTAPGEMMTIAGATGTAGINIIPSGWTLQHRFGALGTIGNASYISSNYDPNAGTVDSSSYGTTEIASIPGASRSIIQFLVGAVNTAPSAKMTIDSDGNVGIGTTTPTQKLEVVGAVKTTSYFTAETAANTGYFDFYNSQARITAKGADGSTMGGFMVLQQASDGSPSNAAIDVQTDGDIILAQSLGNVGIGTTSPGAKLQVVNGNIAIQNANQTSGDYSQAQALQFYQETGATGVEIKGVREAWGLYPFALTFSTHSTSSLDERMRITSNGNVGIGTTTPSALLHLQAAANNQGIILANTYALDAGSTILYMSGKKTDATITTGLIEFLHKGDLHLRTGGTGSATAYGTTRMSISAAGGLSFGDSTYINTDPGAGKAIIQANVGIGVTSPTQMLSVKGIIHSDSTYTNGYYGAWLSGNTTSGTESFLGLGPWYTQAGYVKWIDNSRLSIYTYATTKAVTLQEAGGNVGIGTTAPTSHLHMYGTSTQQISIETSSNSVLGLALNSPGGNWSVGLGKVANDEFDIYDESAVASRFHIRSNGNIGIGTTNPLNLLQVGSVTGTPSIGTSNNSILARGGISFFNADTTTYPYQSEITEDSGSLYISSNEYYSGGWQIFDPNRAPARIVITSASADSYIRFYTKNANSGSPAEAMRITSGSNVGIGTTTPDSKFSLVGTLANSTNLSNIYPIWETVSSNDTNYEKGIDIQAYSAPISSGVTDSGYRIGIASETFINNANFQGTLSNQTAGWFRAGTNTTSPTGRITNSYALKADILYGANTTIDNAYGLYIDSATGPTNNYGIYQAASGAKNYFAGNVGIGTTTPGYKLDVVGRSRVQGSGTNGGGLWLSKSGTPTTDTSYIGRPSVADGDDFTGFYSGSSTTLWNLVVKDTGNVGIGTTTPGAKLDVSGNMNLTGATYLGWGSAAAPSYAFTAGQTTTGMFLPASVQLGFSTNGVERMRIDSNGNVGIGTTAPGYRLDVYPSADSTAYSPTWSSYLPTKAEMRIMNPVSNGSVSSNGEYAGLLFQSGKTTGIGTAMISAIETGTSGYGTSLAFQTRDNASAYYLREWMRIADTGNVGIGTTSPQASLHMAGSSNDLLVGSVGSGGYARLGGNANQAFLAGNQYYSTSTSTTKYSQNGGAGLIAFDISTGATAGDILLRTSPSGTAGDDMTLTTIMTLKQAGNVGIGTTSPGSVLQVSAMSDTTGQGIRIGSSTVAWGAMRTAVTGGAAIAFDTYSGSTWNANVLTLITNGNVGIGTSTPGGKLEVAGNQKFSASTNLLWWPNTSGQTDSRSYGFIGEQGVYGRFELKMSDASDTTLDTTVLGFDRNGNVGIGTSTPSYKLSVASGSVALYNNGWTHMLADAESDNMLANSDFEQGTYGWSGFTNTVSGTGSSYSGNNAGRVLGSRTIANDDYIPVDPTQDVIQLEAYVKKETVGTTPGILYFGFFAYDANKTVITTSPCGTYCYFATAGWTVTADGNWHKVSATRTGEGTVNPNFPVGTRYIRVMALVNYTGSSDTSTLIDHITLRKINNGPLFVGNNFSTSGLVDQYQTSKIYTTSSNHLILEPPSSGNVGIGTTAPGDILNLSFSKQYSGGIKLTNTYNSARSWSMWVNGDDGTGGNGSLAWSYNVGSPSMLINSSGNVGIGTINPDKKLSVIGASGSTSLARFGNYDFVASSTGSGVSINTGASTGNTYTTIAAFTGGGSTAGNLVLNPSGNVGIGTTSPSNKLVINTSTAGDGIYMQESDSATNSFSVRTYTSGSEIYAYQDGTAVFKVDSTYNGSMYFNNGNVGIGTTAPSAKLYVNQAASADVANFLDGGTSIFKINDGGSIAMNGSITYNTSAKPKRSIILTSSGATIPSTGGATQTKVDGSNSTYYVLDFNDTSDNSSFWQWTMPDSYDGGTIDVTFYWEAAATSGNVVWAAQTAGVAPNNSEDIDPTLGTAQTVTDTTQGNANDLGTAAISSWSPGWAAGDYITFKAYRDADSGSDTMSGNARLVKVKVEYSVSSESD